MKDEKLRLECSCHDPYCFVYFWFWFDEFPMANSPRIPTLDVGFRYHPGSLWKRLKKAWLVIRRNEWQEEADWQMDGFESIRKLRDFCDRCLEMDDERRPR